MNEYAVERLLKALQSLTYEVKLFREAYVANNFPSGYEPKTEPQTDEFFRQPTEEEMKSVRDYIDSISVPTGVNVFDLMAVPQTERSE